MLSGDHEHALADFTDAIRLDPTDPVPLHNRCFIHLMAAHYELAQNDCDRAIVTSAYAKNTSRQRSFAFDTRGLLNWKHGRYSDAVSDYIEAISLEPAFATSLYGRGLSELKLGKVKEGNADIKAAFASYPTVDKIFGTKEHISRVH